MHCNALHVFFKVREIQGVAEQDEIQEQGGWLDVLLLRDRPSRPRRRQRRKAAQKQRPRAGQRLSLKKTATAVTSWAVTVAVAAALRIEMAKDLK